MKRCLLPQTEFGLMGLASVLMLGLALLLVSCDYSLAGRPAGFVHRSHGADPKRPFRASAHRERSPLRLRSVRRRKPRRPRSSTTSST